ncbi:MAG: hypothetical protein AVDCRST_MAG93-1627 [uncultured Chloroflexia bacterium]|uniref:Uncharacterized protein n=1 Tax=uncultured Chloroflexia bacterium TaxID=1672391 RepID=A0A6J4IEL5_9CHLR|nr:MAG: hypothetical protein AVDCRST_MAG93-1627 [uncultured Chloroflexia bacterium]
MFVTLSSSHDFVASDNRGTYGMSWTTHDSLTRRDVVSWLRIPTGEMCVH